MTVAVAARILGVSVTLCLKGNARTSWREQMRVV